MARLADGGVAVADGGSQEVRFFDADGDFVRSVAGPGGGPGESTGLAGQRAAAVPPAERPGLRSSLSQIPFPERRPAYGPVLADSAVGHGAEPLDRRVGGDPRGPQP